jgi:hypothetical protein
MATYLIELCKQDGSPPLGQCPEVEVEAENYLDAKEKAIGANPGHEVVSWGLKSEITQARKRGVTW